MMLDTVVDLEAISMMDMVMAEEALVADSGMAGSIMDQVEVDGITEEEASMILVVMDMVAHQDPDQWALEDHAGDRPVG